MASDVRTVCLYSVLHRNGFRRRLKITACGRRAFGVRKKSSPDFSEVLSRCAGRFPLELDEQGRRVPPKEIEDLAREAPRAGEPRGARQNTALQSNVEEQAASV